MDNYDCPICGSEMEYWDGGSFKGVTWEAYKCVSCGNIESNEPEWDDVR